MGKGIDRSELIFRVFAYVFITLLAIFCLYPFIYTISAAMSGKSAMEQGKVILFPIDVQFDAFKAIFEDKLFWISYANTLFLTFFGTLYSMIIAILGAYALSKRRLIKRRLWNFLLVFTLWFSVGMVPMYYNYRDTMKFLNGVGIYDEKWLVVIAMGMAAFNVILLRNSFEGVPSEIEEAAVLDGANEFQILFKVYVPMTKATIATVTLFFGLSRWNGYFWARQMLSNNLEHPIQVFIRNKLEQLPEMGQNMQFDNISLIYAMIVCAIIPIIIIYPYIQKYFARGVNMGGVKE